MNSKTMLTTALALLAGFQLAASVTPAGIFTSNMVLQRDMQVPVWGTANPGESVQVEFAGQKKTATAAKDGTWSVTLDPMKASKSNRTMVISGQNYIELKNILVGDVWLCSGQSNMEMSFGWGIIDGKKFMEESSKYPEIRSIKIPHVTSFYPLATVQTQGPWKVCCGDKLKSTTACGYFFALELNKALGIPVGIIDDNWSGCRIEPFISREGFTMVPELRPFALKSSGYDPKTPEGKKFFTDKLNQMEEWIVEAKKCIAEGKTPRYAMPVFPAISLSSQYNAMIAPIVKFPIKGAIWYQGCSNSGDGIAYFYKKQALVKGWRSAWGYEFPFYFVQLASFRGETSTPEGGDGYAMIRDAQKMCLSIPKTGMAVTIDIGNANDIHPKNKQDVGKRLALWALAKDYGKNVVFSGPLYKSMTVEGNKVRISFDYADSGLMAGRKTGYAPVEEVKNGKLTGFSIQDANGKWYHANAVIEGKNVIVSAPEVEIPAGVRYAFRGNPMRFANLYNKDGLPAAPFATDYPLLPKKQK